ncbi:hypothetical protein OJF2_04020 [Aquisphaera giovannonii]|uniref:Uncharacterized protein n=1 Tax=Aquisphaera giovannonii TaxID=406548 RepID=A0A5B9VVW9_9BACT|nr:hypothetical protein OJF2_04020 [Aquisphaera giovannonii]
MKTRRRFRIGAFGALAMSMRGILKEALSASNFSCNNLRSICWATAWRLVNSTCTNRARVRVRHPDLEPIEERLEPVPPQ